MSFCFRYISYIHLTVLYRIRLNSVHPFLAEEVRHNAGLIGEGWASEADFLITSLTSKEVAFVKFQG